MKLQTKWLSNMSFESELNGHKIIMDADGQFGGDDKGPRPKGLMLVSLMGCTGMDVVSLLNKMQVPFTDFDMAVETELTDEHPKVFKEIHLNYTIYGKDLEKYRDKITKAIALSQDKYCGVSAMLKKNSSINYSIILKEDTNS